MRGEVVYLEKLSFSLQRLLSTDFLISSVAIDEDDIAGMFRVSVRGFVWAETKNVREYEFSYPKDWWAAFKLRWFPQFLLQRYPAEMETKRIDVKAIYPAFRPSVPDEESVLSLFVRN